MMIKIASVFSVLMLATLAVAHSATFVERGTHTVVDVVSYNVVNGQVEPDGRCIGFAVGSFCCIGICIMDSPTVSNSVVKTAKTHPNNLIIYAKEGLNAVVTINKSAGTFDVVNHDDPNY
ncbi:hypothetical protein EDD11_001037, partial [Mortierella claussenii]